MEEKIIQIMPAPQKLHVVYEDKTEGEFLSRVVCLALTDQGSVLMMDTDDFGDIDIIARTKNGLRWV